MYFALYSFFCILHCTRLTSRPPALLLHAALRCIDPIVFCPSIRDLSALHSYFQGYPGVPRCMYQLPTLSPSCSLQLSLFWQGTKGSDLPQGEQGSY